MRWLIGAAALLTGCVAPDDVSEREDDFAGAEVTYELRETGSFRIARGEVSSPQTLEYGFRLQESEQSDSRFIELEFVSRDIAVYEFPDSFVRLRHSQLEYWTQPDCGNFTLTIDGDEFGILWGTFAGELCDGFTSIRVDGEFAVER